MYKVCPNTFVQPKLTRVVVVYMHMQTLCMRYAWINNIMTINDLRVTLKCFNEVAFIVIMLLIQAYLMHNFCICMYTTTTMVSFGCTKVFEFSLIRLVNLTWLFYVRMDELNDAASLNESSLIDDTFLGI